jgi:hypothetical protein
MEVKMSDRTPMEIFAVRLPAWTKFQVKKLMESQNQSATNVISAAVRVYLSTLNIPETIVQGWIAEYHAGGKNAVD